MAEGLLDIHPDLLVQICKRLKSGQGIQCFEVIENGLPEDANVVSSAMHNGVIRMTLESAEFTAGEVLLPPTLRANYTGSSNDRHKKCQ